MEIPICLKDAHLRISENLYSTVCIPFRVLLGLFFVLVQSKSKWTCLLLQFLALFVIFGLGYKRFINPTSWKHYYRPISVYIVIFLLATWCILDKKKHLPLQAYAGILIIVDALIGKQGQYLVQILSKPCVLKR